MARPIEHVVRPPKIGPDAHEELERLLETCHRHGVLRLAHDLVAANTGVAKVVVDELSKPAAMNAIQNLAILAMALARVPPNDFARVALAAADGLVALRPNGAVQDGHAAPGVRGLYRALHDDALWQRLAPLLNGIGAVLRGLERPVESPIAAFSGKSGRPQ